jgi:hypothetical protein
MPSSPVQLDVHHRDGDRENDDPQNLETLCANCHRLETNGWHFRPARCSACGAEWEELGYGQGARREYTRCEKCAGTSILGGVAP